MTLSDLLRIGVAGTSIEGWEFKDESTKEGEGTADFDWGDEVSVKGGTSVELYWEGKVVLEFGKKVDSLFCDWTMLCCWVFGDKNSEKFVSVCIGKWMDEGTFSCICIECEKWFELEA